MDKLKLAHDWAMKVIEGNVKAAIQGDLCEMAWKYADAMQAEADSRVNKERPDVLGEWQPDWSQAPDDAGYWAMDENGLCIWYKDKPEIHIDQWDFGDVIGSSKSFGYIGNWQDSLRKRP